MPKSTFPGFDYKAQELSAYIFSVDIFIISLKSGKIVRFEPRYPAQFREWLTFHGIRDITAETGKLITDYYFSKKP